MSSGSWPFQQSCVFSLPTELERCVHRFTGFYGGQHSGRKLNWLYHMSKGELITNCFKNRLAPLLENLKIESARIFYRDFWLSRRRRQKKISQIVFARGL